MRSPVPVFHPGFTKPYERMARIRPSDWVHRDPSAADADLEGPLVRLGRSRGEVVHG